MKRKVIVPLDGSTLGEAILPHVKGICSGAETDVILLTVVPDAPEGTGVVTLPFAPIATGPVIIQADERTREEVVREARQYLEDVRARMEFGACQVETVVRVGDPPGEIISLAKSVGADLIAMSTHGRTGLPRVLFGSVAGEVLRKSGVPVLMLRAVMA